MENNSTIIWTIGHSTLAAQEFLHLLDTNHIRIVADIRRFPGSRKYPHFNRENMETWLHANGIRYFHFEALGGRRKPSPGSLNDAWRSPSFRGYADYMESDAFLHAMDGLIRLAQTAATAYMCSESVWWRCHRALISDYLKAKGWTVLHITGNGKTAEHPFSPAANFDGERLSYKKPENPGGKI